MSPNTAIVMSYFNTVIDNCRSSPCQNGGSCSNNANRYSCSCITGYTGNECQTG